MEKNDKGSVYQVQKANKPRIGDMIDTHLENDFKTAAEDFVEFIKLQKMTPQWYAADSFSVSYRNKRVCIIKMQAGSWWIWSYARYDGGFDSSLADESAEIKETILNNMLYCHHCGGCAPGEDAIILGRSLSSLCRMPVIWFQNPNRDELEFAKKLVMLRRRAIANNEVPKVSYIAISKRNNG